MTILLKVQVSLLDLRTGSTLNGKFHTNSYTETVVSLTTPRLRSERVSNRHTGTRPELERHGVSLADVLPLLLSWKECHNETSNLLCRCFS